MKLVKDLIYPQRTLIKNGETYQFKNFHAEVPDKVAIELLQTGDYEIVKKVGENDPYIDLFEFKYDSWVKNRKLILDTAIGAENGYGKSGITIARGLQHFTDLYVLNNGYISSDIRDIPEDLQEIIKKPIDPIDSWYMLYWPGFNFKRLAERQVGYTMLEATRIPDNWVKAINESCERVIVPCVAQKEAFINSGVKKDIAIIPLPLDMEMYPYKEREEQEEFIFGIEGTLTYRKGVDQAVIAFEKAFPKKKYPKVRLFIKTRAGHGSPFAKKIELKDGIITINDDPRIAVVAETWSEDQLIKDFYHSIDCYVFLTRGEGFGLTTVQAMATGLPIIATDASGVQDQFDHRHGWKVNTKIVDVPNDYVWRDGEVVKPDNGDTSKFGVGYPEDLRAEGQQWWDADIDHAVEAMREVYNNQKEAIKRGKVASQHVRKVYDHKVIAEQIVEYLDSKI